MINDYSSRDHSHESYGSAKDYGDATNVLVDYVVGNEFERSY